MSLALDGHNQGNNGYGSTVTATLTTTNPSDVILGFVSYQGGSDPVSSVTDNSGVTAAWQRRVAVPNGGDGLEEWWTTSTGILSGTTITASFPNNDYLTLNVVAISGANTASPFDGHSGLPIVGTSDPLSISTTNANTFIVAGNSNGNIGPSAGSGWTQIDGGNALLTEYQIVSSPQSGLSVTLGTGAGQTYAMIVDAIVQAGSGGSSPVLMPTRRTFVRRKRPDFSGWNPISDPRTRPWRREGSLLMPERKLILPRKAA